VGSVEYWRQCIPEILGDHGVCLPHETMDAIAQDVASCAGVECEATGVDAIPNPDRLEIANLRKQLANAKDEAQQREMAYQDHILRKYDPSVRRYIHVAVIDERVEITSSLL
jgi:hypothetical protein